MEAPAEPPGQTDRARQPGTHAASQPASGLVETGLTCSGDMWSVHAW
jgi:hypothetical protein